MSGPRTRTLAWSLAALLLCLAPAAGQSLVGPQPTDPGDRKGGAVSLGDGGGSELPGPAVSSPKTGGPGSAVPPGLPGAPTLGPLPGGGGGGVVVPPDDDPPGGDGGHGDGGDDGGDKDPPGDGTTPGGADDPPDDGSTPGTSTDAPGTPRWRLELSAESDGVTLRLERLNGPTRLAVTWRLVLPRPTR